MDLTSFDKFHKELTIRIRVRIGIDFVIEHSSPNTQCKSDSVLGAGVQPVFR